MTYLDIIVRNDREYWTRGCRLLRHPRAAGIPGQGHGSTTTVDAETEGFRHSEAAGRGIPYGGAERYVIVTMEEPTVGFFACWRRL